MSDVNLKLNKNCLDFFKIKLDETANELTLAPLVDTVPNHIAISDQDPNIDAVLDANLTTLSLSNNLRDITFNINEDNIQVRTILTIVVALYDKDKNSSSLMMKNLLLHTNSTVNIDLDDDFRELKITLLQYNAGVYTLKTKYK